MNKKVVLVSVIIAVSLGLSSAYGLGEEGGKVSVLQKMKNAYNDFRARQQQRSQNVNNEAIKQSSATKVAASQIASPEAASPQVTEAGPKSKDKEMTREEIIAKLKEDFADNDEVINLIPELKAAKNRAGNTTYVYNGTELEKLSEDDLNGLYIRVRQNLVRIRTERIERQLETVRNINRLQSVSTPSQPMQPPRAPSVSPSVPKVPSTPRGPPSPPAVPQRR